jgi:hypothetical protein
MKAKLIKTLEQLYKLKFYNIEDMFACATALLSKQNCDEIFGVVDVKEVIAKNMLDHNIVDKAVDFSNANPENNGAYLAYIAGASEAFKAMELNKDKVFTLEQMSVAYNTNRSGTLFEQLINSFGGQPTEIEVEIELICPHPSDTYRCGIQYGCDGDGCNHPDQVPCLDSEGCLILKKK